MENYRYKTRQIPWLMLAPDPEKYSTAIEFYNPSKDMTFPITLPEVNGRKCFSSKGWLLTICERSRMSLLHPFSRLEINLPLLKKIYELKAVQDVKHDAVCINKFVLSANPLRKAEYTVMVIYRMSWQLAHWKSGDEAWTIIDGDFQSRDRISDVIYKREHGHGQFYSINWGGQIKAHREDNPSVAQVVAEMPHQLIQNFDEYDDKLYLVESSGPGSLLVVRREVTAQFPQFHFQPLEEFMNLHPLEGFMNQLPYHVAGFQVFKVDLSTNKWMKVKHLGNRALFLGRNSSMSIEASDSTHCKPNCIYFAYSERAGIYNMEDKSVVSNIKGNSSHHLRRSMWVEETLEWPKETVEQMFECIKK